MMTSASQSSKIDFLSPKRDNRFQTRFTEKAMYKKEKSQVTLSGTKTSDKKKKAESATETPYQQRLNHRHEMMEEIKKKGFFTVSYTDPSVILASIEEYRKQMKPDEIKDELFLPFKLYNVNDDQIRLHVRDVNNALSDTRIIIPREVLSLAFLNRIDEYLAMPYHSSVYFKTCNVLEDFSLGRRSSGTRFLVELGYIKKRGNQWKRLEKGFDEQDFWIE